MHACQLYMQNKIMIWAASCGKPYLFLDELLSCVPVMTLHYNDIMLVDTLHMYYI